jgi:hypothetical protein
MYSIFSSSNKCTLLIVNKKTVANILKQKLNILGYQDKKSNCGIEIIIPEVIK